MDAEGALAVPLPPPPQGNTIVSPQFGGAVLALPALVGREEEYEEEDLSRAAPASASYGGEQAEAYDVTDGGREFEAHKYWDSEALGDSREDLVVSGELRFLARFTRFASFQGTAGFMSLAPVPPPLGQDGGGKGGGVIAVHYRHTCFWRHPTGGDGVAVCDGCGTRIHHVRYMVPSFAAVVADPVTSLRLVGAALVADVYQHRDRMQLQAVWSGLLVAAGPAWATGLEVTVDVGVLRGGGEDHRMAYMWMCDELAVVARRVYGSRMAVSGERLLPAPVCRDVSGDEDAWPSVEKASSSSIQGTRHRNIRMPHRPPESEEVHLPWHARHQTLIKPQDSLPHTPGKAKHGC
ncbi:hypothetical protein BS78_K238500 [Paspalum vaginatum]|uniref:Uncharacterized protein n=1 Tax=Paspalum vaginatum TaxID=158149 RepID=A0A9W7XE73_9POAL|nr:hypothetical protein BS78_K238500 [Paspalum vaginatum]